MQKLREKHLKKEGICIITLLNLLLTAHRNSVFEITHYPPIRFEIHSFYPGAELAWVRGDPAPLAPRTPLEPPQAPPTNLRRKKEERGGGRRKKRRGPPKTQSYIRHCFHQ